MGTDDEDEPSSDDDEPDIPSGWHEGVWIYARFIYWDSIGDIARAQYSATRWSQWVTDKPDEIGDEEFWDEDKGTEISTSTKRGLDFDHED